MLENVSAMAAGDAEQPTRARQQPGSSAVAPGLLPIWGP